MNDAFYIAAERISLVTVPTAVLAHRLRSPDDEFVAATTLDLAGTTREVVYPASWPGDALKMFAGVLARRQAGDPRAGYFGAIVDRALGIAVGNMGTHGLPVAGRVEVGYGIVPAYAGRGYASEMLRSFTSYMFARDALTEVAAETLRNNHASMRVLEKNGFARVGLRVDADGPLVVWSKVCAA